MARKARPGVGTVVKFIAIDDDSIGGDPTTIVKRYAEYISTANHSVLEIDRDRNPSYYYFHQLNSRHMAKIQSVMSSIGALMRRRLADLEKIGKGEKVEEETAEEKQENQELNDTYELLREEIVEACFIGCDGHKVVTKILDDGDMDFEEVRWEVGTPRPAGLIKSIVGDQILIDNIVHYLVRTSTLKEKEKKQ